MNRKIQIRSVVSFQDSLCSGHIIEQNGIQEIGTVFFGRHDERNRIGTISSMRPFIQFLHRWKKLMVGPPAKRGWLYRLIDPLFKLSFFLSFLPNDVSSPFRRIFLSHASEGGHRMDAVEGGGRGVCERGNFRG